MEQEERARIAIEKAQLKDVAERQAVGRNPEKEQVEKEAQLEGEASSERIHRFPEEERAREAKKEAERQAFSMEPQILEEARRKGQEARARAFSVESEEPARIAKRKAQQAATLPTVKPPETTVRISGAAGSNPYWTRVQSIISSQWEPPPVDMAGQTYTMIVKFRLLRDGTIQDVVVQQSSGNVYFDIAGQRAVLRPRILPVFPAELADSYKDVEVVFRVGESPG